MDRRITAVLYAVVMAALIVAVDFTFLRHHLQARLIVNISIAVVFLVVYFSVFRRR